MSQPSFVTPLMALLCLSAAHATNIQVIPVGSISDHADKSIEGSIADYFDDISNSAVESVFQLEAEVYEINQRLTVPENVTLIGTNSSNPEETSEIKALSGLDRKTMMEVGSNTRFENLIINGNDEPRIVVDANQETEVEFINCTIKRAKDDFSRLKDNGEKEKTSVYLLELRETTNCLVSGCTITNAGYPRDVPAADINGWGVMATQSKNLTVQDSIIGQIASGGIGITSALNATIINNTIYEAGMNFFYEAGAFADGITGYDSGEIPETHPLSWYVAFNHIYDCGNHGIHVSGKGVVFEGNVTERTRFPGIAVSDWRSPHMYSSDVLFLNNSCEPGSGEDSPSDNNPEETNAIHVKWYYGSTFEEEGNNVAAVFNTSTEITNPVGPQSFMFCGNENSMVEFLEPVDLAYGANGSYSYLNNFTGKITFNNSTFGDPIPGVLKRGFYKESTPDPIQENIALSATVTASSQYSNFLRPSKAADGDGSTRWNAADRSGGDEWLQLDFGQTRTFNAVRIDEFRNRIGDWSLQKSDDSVSWTTFYEGSGLTDDVILFESQSCRYIRLYIENLVAGLSASVYEFEVGTPKVEGVASASSVYSTNGTYAAEKANDGNLSTRWNAGSGSFGDEWLQFDFGTPQVYDLVRFDEFRNRIGDWRLQKSDDGLTWKTINSGNGLGDRQIELYAPQTSRFLRLYIDSLSASSSASIYEMEALFDNF